ncbi:uncharacterized protein PgNI_02987, partial [Pyricularia grisea]|uniref:Uncharacterized protein n=1 Tax=Pyricularia grisea TaxID=148305 RepID=A0A6P8B8E1_PYRGI
RWKRWECGLALASCRTIAPVFRPRKSRGWNKLQYRPVMCSLLCLAVDPRETEYQRENRDHGEGCIRKSIVLSSRLMNSGRIPAKVNEFQELRCKSRPVGKRIPLIPQNELGWQQQQQQQ